MLSLHIPQLPRTGQPGGLVAASRRLPGDLSLDDWRGGVAFNKGCHTGGGTTRCDLNLSKLVSQIGDVAEFEPDLLWTPVFECDLSNLDVTREAARMHLETVTGELIVAALESGGGSNPTFIDAATDITPATPSGFAASIAGLVEELAGCNVFDVFIHIPIGYESYLLQAGLIEWDAMAGIYRMGPHTVVFDKYSNVGPTGSPPPAGDGSQVYVYASGPVYLELADVMLIEHRGPAANTHRVTAERMSITVFDPCCVAAALVEVC